MKFNETFMAAVLESAKDMYTDNCLYRLILGFPVYLVIIIAGIFTALIVDFISIFRMDS